MIWDGDSIKLITSYFKASHKSFVKLDILPVFNSTTFLPYSARNILPNIFRSSFHFRRETHYHATCARNPLTVLSHLVLLFPNKQFTSPLLRNLRTSLLNRNQCCRCYQGAVIIMYGISGTSLMNKHSSFSRCVSLFNARSLTVLFCSTS